MSEIQATATRKGTALKPSADSTDGRAPAAARPILEQLVAEHQSRLTRLVYRLLGWSGDVSDVVQDVLVAAVGSWPQFRGDSEAATWLTKIAINRCRAYRRRRLLSWRRMVDWHSRREINAPAGDTAPADVAAIESETARQVRLAVQTLGQTDREVIVLHYLEELPIAEVAGLLLIKPNAAQARLSRARQRLKKILGPMLEL